MEEKNEKMALAPMTEVQGAVFLVESYLNENYQFRKNVLSDKVEMFCIHENEDSAQWQVMTPALMNSIVRKAKKDGIGGDKSPRKNIEEYVLSTQVQQYNPIKEFLLQLPTWDGQNRISQLFSRIPGITSEQLAWCSTWLRSAVAHWLDIDNQHGNECVPVLIGEQGCGKSTFALRLLPEQLREYYLDHINFGNKFDCEMALTHNLLVNIDEFANMGPSQQGKLKQTLSKVKVNGRPIFGKCQEDRKRYASFIATTNNEHPLCDPTGSRRYLCMKVTKGALIDNISPIAYDQLYAQVMYELNEQHTPYWFNNDEVARIQRMNSSYFKSDELETLLTNSFRIPSDSETGIWMLCSEVFSTLQLVHPHLMASNATKIRIGQTLKYLGCQSKHTNMGQKYHLIKLTA